MPRPLRDEVEIGHTGGVRGAVEHRSLSPEQVAELDAIRAEVGKDIKAMEDGLARMRARNETRTAFRFLGFCCLWALLFGACCVVAAL